MSTAQQYFHDGELNAAIEAAAAEVRQSPASAVARGFYAELLCFAGQLEKADLQLEAMLKIDTSLAIPVGTWRQLVRAAQMRDDVFQRGAAPAFAQDPSARLSTLLEALTDLRNGDTANAARLLTDLEAQRPAQPRVINGNPATDVRELDDLTAGVVEAMAANGHYYWLDLDDISELHLESPTRPLDLLWRPAQVLLADGTDGKVFIPATYPLPGDNDALRLGRATEWVEEHGIVRGQGQRMWLVGDDVLAFSELESLAVSAEPVSEQGVAG